MIELKKEDEEDKVPMYCMTNKSNEIVKITPKILKNEVLMHIFYVSKKEAEEINNPHKIDHGVIIDDMCCIHDTKGYIKERLIKLGYISE